MANKQNQEKKYTLPFTLSIVFSHGPCGINSTPRKEGVTHWTFLLLFMFIIIWLAFSWYKNFSLRICLYKWVYFQGVYMWWLNRRFYFPIFFPQFLRQYLIFCWHSLLCCAQAFRGFRPFELRYETYIYHVVLKFSYNMKFWNRPSQDLHFLTHCSPGPRLHLFFFDFHPMDLHFSAWLLTHFGPSLTQSAQLFGYKVIHLPPQVRS